jgi:hypothetical protein
MQGRRRLPTIDVIFAAVSADDPAEEKYDTGLHATFHAA